MRDFLSKKRWYILAILTALTLTTWSAVLAREPSGVLTVRFLDVGQGDAIFIEAPNGNQVLIDSGKGRAVLRGLGESMKYFDREIDVAIATHPDFDHIGGFPDIFERYEIGMVLETGNGEGEADYEAFSSSIAGEGSNVTLARRGHIVNLGGGVYLRVLYPDEDPAGMEPNEASIITQLVYGETSFLLTGDAPVAAERSVMELDRESVRSNVLQAGHHGSKTSSGEAFVGRVSPEYAVVSAGCDNSYGHPHQEVLDVFERFEVEVFTTCKHGTVTFVSDGEEVGLSL